MSIPEDRLQALVDGALPPAEAAALEIEIAGDVAAQAYVARQRALRRRVEQDFALALEAPIPDRLRNLVRQEPNVVRGRIPWRGALVGGGGWALAAGLALALLARGPEGGLVAPSEGALFAKGALAAALEQDLSGADLRRGPAGEARAVASFQAADGRFCRIFEAQAGNEAHAGLACREARGWSVVALVASEPLEADPTGFRTASSGLPGLVLEAADELRQGDPLDAAGESAAQAHRWLP